MINKCTLLDVLNNYLENIFSLSLKTLSSCIMGRMFNPPHPGEIIKEDVLPELGISVTEAALQLGLTRVALSRVINGRAAISTELALKLEEWLDGPTAEVWLGMQLDHDLWRARNKPRLTA